MDKIKLDTTIIGGGIVGLMIAYEIRKISSHEKNGFLHQISI